MMTLNLWRAEWMKLRRRPLNLGILFFTLGLLSIGFIILTILALVNPNGWIEIAKGTLPFPNSIVIAIGFASNIGTLMVTIFVANSVGSEYSHDTWKMILPRYGSRLAFLLTKVVASLVVSIIWIATLMLAAGILGWLGSLLLNIQADRPLTNELFTQIGMSVIITILQMFFYGMLTLLITLLTRSALGGAIVSIMTPVILSVLSFLSHDLALILPNTHVDNLQARWVERREEQIQMMNVVFGKPVSSLTSLLVELGYMLVFMLLAFWLFRKRDLAGN